MDWIQQVLECLVPLKQVLGYLIPFILVLSILVFFHELGHYLVARYNQVKIEVFSIGFGPEVFGWNDRVGTRWKVSWLPLGGYVKMWGDENAASAPDHDALKEMTAGERSQSLHAKTVWQRMAVSAAGPFANYLLAFVLFSFVFMTQGYRSLDPEPVIGGVIAESVAFKGGLQKGDRILSINNQKMKRFEDVVAYVRSRAGEPLSFQVERSGRSLVLPLVPEATLSSVTAQKGKMVGRLGIYGRETFKKDLNFFHAMAVAAQELAVISWQTLKGIGQMIFGQRSLDGMGGPLMIAQLSGEIAQVGMGALLSFMAVLSINLGLINLFPIPLLDGGHLFLYGIEALRGKPLSEKALHFCYRIGLWIVLGLFVLSTWNDLNRLRIFQWVGNFLGF